MKNKLSDLNNYLFEQIERLQSEEVETDLEKLEREIQKTNAICNISKAIADNSRLALEAQKHFDEYGKNVVVNNELLGVKNG